LQAIENLFSIDGAESQEVFGGSSGHVHHWKAHKGLHKAVCDGETCRPGCNSLKEEETTHLRSLEGH